MAAGFPSLVVTRTTGPSAGSCAATGTTVLVTRTGTTRPSTFLLYCDVLASPLGENEITDSQSSRPAEPNFCTMRKQEGIIMPKRLGNLYKEVVSLDNCYKAVLEGTASLKRTRKIKHIRKHPLKYALDVQLAIIKGWTPSAVRCQVIEEGPNRKERKLVIPSTFDHLVHVAIMRVIQPALERRFDFASCGSIPGGGQHKAQKIIHGWMKNSHPKYALDCDIYHFYESLQADVIMNALKKIIKDKKYLALHEKILKQMNGLNCDVINNAKRPFEIKGIAIGFSVSHWYANLVLTSCDRMLREKFPTVKFVRYMDNYEIVCNRKRTLHKVREALSEKLATIKLRLKGNWQIFPIKKRPVQFLSYRYYRSGKIEVRKKLFYRITRKTKITKKNTHVHNCRSFISLIGILQHSDSYSYYMEQIYPVITTYECRKRISRFDKRNLLQAA